MQRSIQEGRRAGDIPPQFTCFTSAKVQKRALKLPFSSPAAVRHVRTCSHFPCSRSSVSICTSALVKQVNWGGEAETAVFLACGGAAGRGKSTNTYRARVQGEGLYWADCAVRSPNPEFLDAALRDSIWRQASQLLDLPA